MKTTPAQYEPFLRRVVELGAAEAKVIKPSTVVTADWVGLKCPFGCDGYGSSLCCPPNSPTPEQTRRTLDGYQAAIFAHFGASVHFREAVEHALCFGWVDSKAVKRDRESFLLLFTPRKPDSTLGIKNRARAEMVRLGFMRPQGQALIDHAKRTGSSLWLPKSARETRGRRQR